MAGPTARADLSEVGTGRTSFAALYERHAPAALRLAYLLTGERELAEDLMQDAFVKVLGRYQNLRQPDAFDAYLRRTIVNLSYSTFRRRRLERTHASRERLQLASTRLAPGPAIEIQDELWRRLQRVAPRQRGALVLRYYLDLSERETADLLGCSVSSVKSLISRGLAALREQLEDSEEDR